MKTRRKGNKPICVCKLRQAGAILTTGECQAPGIPRTQSIIREPLSNDYVHNRKKLVPSRFCEHFSIIPSLLP